MRTMTEIDASKVSWQDQYNLTQDSVTPQSMRKLLAILKNIEKMMENQAAKEKGKTAKQENKTDLKNQASVKV